MAKVGKFCLAKRVKVEWLFQKNLVNQLRLTHKPMFGLI